MKKIVSFILVCCLVVAMLPVTVFARSVTASGECGNNLTWTLYDDGEMVISGTGAMWDYSFTDELCYAPWYSNSDSIKSVTVGNDVTSIGYCAFYNCMDIGSVTIGDSVTTIGKYAFYNSGKFNSISITIPNSVTSIGYCAFDESTVASVEIHGYVGSTAEAYANENGYTFVALAEREVTASGTCGDNLTWVLYDDGELVISGTGEMWDYEEDPGNVDIEIPLGSIGDAEEITFELAGDRVAPWRSYSEYILTVTIDAAVTSISQFAFYYCENLTNVNISETVTSIGMYAFSGCISITKATIYSRTAMFDYGIFDSATADFEIHGYAGSTAETYASENGHTFVALSEIIASGTCGDNLTWVLYYDGELVISGTGTMTNWESSSSSNVPWYDYRSQIETVTVESGVTSIGAYALYDCDSLTSINLGDSVTSIGRRAFYECNGLTDVEIPDNVTSIGWYAFYNCDSLKNVSIGDGVTSIGYEAFAYCDSLASVEIGASVTSIGTGAFRGTGITNIVIPYSVTTIGAYAFGACVNLTKATICSRNVTIGTKAFVDTPTTFELHGYADSPAEAYAIENGHTFVALEEPEKFNLSGVTMTLGASLSLDFAIDTSKITGTDNYAKMTIVYADGRPSETVTVPQSEWTQYSGNIYTASFTGMSAKQMNDVVTAVFYNTYGQPLTYEKSDSIETYAVRMLNGSAASNAKLRKVYVDMLNYGSAAQTFFGYDEANLANRNLTETQKSWATSDVVTLNKRISDESYAGTTLTLESEIQLDFVFYNSAVGTDYSQLYAIATYTDHYGNYKRVRIEGSDFIAYSSSLCQVSVTGMAVADFRSLVKCTVYNADGDEVGSASDSVESYAKRNAASLGDVASAIVKFCSASYTYFHGAAKCVITFDANGGEVSEATRTVAYGDAIGELPVPTRTDFNFLGWYTAGGEAVSETAIATTVGEVKFTAKWECTNYSYAVFGELADLDLDELYINMWADGNYQENCAVIQVRDKVISSINVVQFAQLIGDESWQTCGAVWAIYCADGKYSLFDQIDKTASDETLEKYGLSKVEIVDLTAQSFNTDSETVCYFIDTTVEDNATVGEIEGLCHIGKPEESAYYGIGENTVIFTDALGDDAADTVIIFDAST